STEKKDGKERPLDEFEQLFELPKAGRGGIYGVRQILIWETAAVRRIDAIAMGSPEANGHRTAGKPLVSYKGKPATALDGDGDKGKVKQVEKLTPNGFLRERYLDVTPQYRRLPVAMVLIVDPDHTAKVQTAFADSELRLLM